MPPVFHMHEVSGRMTEIVKKFLQNAPLDLDELGNLRWYVHQWVAFMPRKPADFDSILSMNQQELRDYCNVLLDWGIDPF